MERALVKQKENIVQKQVAVGREFKVCYIIGIEHIWALTV